MVPRQPVSARESCRVRRKLRHLPPAISLTVGMVRPEMRENQAMGGDLADDYLEGLLPERREELALEDL